MAILASRALADPVPQQDRHVTFVNQTGQPVYSIHASASNWLDESGWTDRLGDRVIMPGQSFTIDFDNHRGDCLFDFKIILKDHSEIIRRLVDVCRNHTWMLGAE